MFGEYNDVQWAGLGFVYLGITLILALAVRRYVPVLKKLYLPASVIAGFLILLLGPQVLGVWLGGDGLIPQGALDVMARLPGIMINIVFAGIMIGKTLPKMKSLWNDAAPHVIFGTVFSFGQFALGAFAVFFIMTPFFGLPEVAASLLEVSFAGGHGTIAGMGGMFEEAGAGELIDIGLGLATISMLTGILGGSALVSLAMRSSKIDVARKHPLEGGPARLSEISSVTKEDQPEEDIGLGSIGRSFGAITIAVALGIVILNIFRFIGGLLGTDVFDNFPLFPFTVIGGLIVQLILTLTKQEHIIERRTVNEVTGLALDILIAAAIGTLSLAALGANVPSLIIFTLIGLGWSVVGLLWLGPRIHKKNWFEHSIADYGQSQGNVATGFILADMVDPKRITGATNGYGYKQLIYEPFLGGGIITALSVPLILQFGSLWFGIGSAVLTVVFILWGVLRRAPKTT